MIQIILLFITGLSTGSFLNVLIDRLPKGETILGRSHCDYCRHKLSWFDLVPLMSFFILGQKCRYCHKKLSRQYPVVEFISGLLFVFTFLSINELIDPSKNIPVSIYYLVVISGLIVIFVSDLKCRIIPDQIVFMLICSAFLYLILFQKGWILNHLIAAGLIFMIFLFLVIITKGRGMGMGDVKYSFAMGLILGLPKTIIAFYIAFLTGALVSMILVMRGRKSIKSTIPFGPFLVSATFVSLFYGEKLWEIFKGFIGI